MTAHSEKFVLFILATINFTHILDFTVMMPMGTQLMRHFHLSHQTFGYLVSAYTISASFSGFFLSFWVDNYNRKTILLWGYTGFALSTLGCGFAPTFGILFCMRMLSGLFGGLIAGQIMAIVSDLIPFERRGRAIGFVSSAFSLATIVGVPFGLFVATHIHWQVPFIYIGLLGLCILPCAYWGLPAMEAHIQKYKRFRFVRVVYPIWRNKPQQLGILLLLMLTFGQFILMPHLATHMIVNVGLQENELPLIYFFSGLITFFTSPIIGKLADIKGQYRVLLWGIVLSSLLALIITHLSVVPLYVVVILTTLFFVVTGARIIPLQALTTNLVPPQQRGSYLGIMGALQQFIMGIASIIAGYVVYESKGHLQNYGLLGIIGVSVSALSILVALRLRHYNTSLEVQKDIRHHHQIMWRFRIKKRHH